MASPPTPNATRIFIDSNVFVTASISEKGTGRELIEYALAGKVDAYISEIEPKDVPIVAAAIEAGALYLVTFDAKHLLRQKEQIWDDYGVMVLTPLQVIHSLPVE